MKDGLYRVVTRYYVAGFVVTNGRITRCAPILKTLRDSDWLRYNAAWIAP